MNDVYELTTINDVRSTKLFVNSDNSVWKLCGNKLPELACNKIRDIFKVLTVPEKKRLRIVGGQYNVDLILEAWQRRHESNIESIEVCSPIRCQVQPNSPDRTLIAMRDRSCALSPSLGGWKKFDENDFSIYWLNRYFSSDGKWTDECKNIFRAHPMFIGMSFISNINYELLTRIVSKILDPRWFIDLMQPDRNAKMESYLGVLPNIVTAYESNRNVYGVDKYAMIKDCWGSVEPTDKTISDPGNFLWRIKQSSGSLAASKKFLEYLRDIWLNGVVTDSHKGRLFSPKSFFTREQDCAAFKAHISSHSLR